VVAAAGLRRFAWPVAAGIAAAFIAVLALHGERPQPGLARFAPAGVLADWPVERISEIEVVAATRRRSFHRHDGEDWHAETGDAPAGVNPGERIEAGLKLLRNSAPQRILEASEVAGRPMGEFGLAPPLLTVTARTASGVSIAIEFGAANPLGLARYTRVVGRPELLLLSTFVAEPWERLAEGR
jgi:hypothetical protein